MDINELILSNEARPYNFPDGNTYLNGDYHLAVMEGRMDLKMIQCIAWSRDPRYEATAEELYAICPDYINGRKMCYGMGKNRVTDDQLHLPSPDHIIPIAKGGPKTIDNLKIIPLKYNVWKRDILKEDWQDFKQFMDGHL